MFRHPSTELGNTLARLRTFFRGGLFKGVYESFNTSMFYVGSLKGIDEFGNRYYENREMIPNRQRWVIPSNLQNFDGSRIPSEWHPWLHCSCDETPDHKLIQDLIPRFKLNHEPYLLNQQGFTANYKQPGTFGGVSPRLTLLNNPFKSSPDALIDPPCKTNKDEIAGPVGGRYIPWKPVSSR